MAEAAKNRTSGGQVTGKTEQRIGYLEIVRDAHVSTITMQRAEKLNAMTAQFWTDLRQALDLLAADGMTRVVIITGSGKAFSAGGDIRGFLDLETIEDMRAYQDDAMAAFSHVEQSPLIVIAAINGLAFGGGCELALACDIVIAAQGATFAMPEAALGLVPGFGAIRATDVMGRQMAKYMIATGDAIDAERALAIGLVQVLSPDARLMDEALTIAKRIAGQSPNAVSIGKRMINRTIDPAAFTYSSDEITALQVSEDRNRGIEAFLAKRPPVFGPRPGTSKPDS